MSQTQNPQLKMVLAADRLDQPPTVQVPPQYLLRGFQPADEPSFLKLMASCDWHFDEERLQYCYSRVLPDGWFVITSRDPQRSGQLVATAMALHNYSGRSTYSGTLGWVGCDPDHRGQGLGKAVTAAVITRLIAAGYRDIELYTEDFREPAIETYFRLGYVPYLYNQPVTETWRDVCQRLGRPFTPDVWPQGNNAYPKF